MKKSFYFEFKHSKKSIYLIGVESICKLIQLNKCLPEIKSRLLISFMQKKMTIFLQNVSLICIQKLIIQSINCLHCFIIPYANLLIMCVFPQKRTIPVFFSH